MCGFLNVLLCSYVLMPESVRRLLFIIAATSNPIKMIAIAKTKIFIAIIELNWNRSC
jgi:hypothetical protein